MENKIIKFKNINSAQDLIDNMQSFGFYNQAYAETNNKFMFYNKDFKIVCEVFKERSQFQFAYTNMEMVGMLLSGIFDDITDSISSGVFESLLEKFNHTVKILRQYYGE